ncbi:MAG: hypothetical protein HYX65_02500 [Gemmatimonadetes bacterium]|nr:hypothetical protein [Gemmatimonadota bacterium]
MKALLGILMLSAAFAVGTYTVGWWAVPVLGAAWGLAATPDRRPARVAGLSAALGWCALFALTASYGSAMEVATAVGTIMKAGTAGFLALMLLFPLALAASAAGVTSALRGAST